MTAKSSPQFNAFCSLVSSVMAVSKEELLRREKEYEMESAQNPRRRGPKPKPSAYPDPSAS